MSNIYSFSEAFKNGYSLILTKIFFRKARLIRRPVYIRGKKSLNGGERLTIGRFCRFDLEGSKKTLLIGKNCQFGDMTHIVAHEKVTIGDNVLIASKVFISDTSHGSYKGSNQSDISIPPADRELVTNPVSIGNNVWIGENVVILGGANIGEGSIIGANAIITKNIEAGSIVVGNNRVIKKYNNESHKWEAI